ncbi:MAG: squalene-hopene/tetraprenyl-beta-curcumene cyclase, partial [Planctomycetota bacterium]
MQRLCRQNSPLLTAARARLLGERRSAEHWVGELSSSALSTATATAALTLAHTAQREAGLELDATQDDLEACIRAGREWLCATQNADGGWGDTTDSPSNLSTTALGLTALTMRKSDAAGELHCITRARAWIESQLGQALEARSLCDGLESIYGDDRTFAIPILTAVAIGADHRRAADPDSSGALRDPWRPIRSLPFELSVLPRGLFRFLGLPVVSYALPALIGIGQAIHHNAPSRNPLARLARSLTRKRSLRVLDSIQPANGGFLEAIPLTSFVVLSLLASGSADQRVVRRGVQFLMGGVRPDGSWPIDTNLATWLTTLSINALAGAGRLQEHLPADATEQLATWLLTQQGQVTHPYTGA